MDIFWDGSTTLGECPVWDDRTDTLYWEDISGLTIHRQTMSGEHEQRTLPGRPGSFALTNTDGVLLVAMENSLVWFDWDSSTITPWFDLEPAGNSNRLNDGRCDRDGRFWVGSMNEDTSLGQTTGLLHRVHADQSHTIARTEIGVSNGLAFSPDGKTMYFADSPSQTIWAYDYHRPTGRARNPRVFVDTNAVAGSPDGATVDADGCYWMAGVFGGVLNRFTPDGTLDRVVELPVFEPTMVAFGGTDLRTLFVTSFGKDITKGDGPAGSILALDVGVQGLTEPRFAGLPD